MLWKNTRTAKELGKSFVPVRLKAYARRASWAIDSMLDSVRRRIADTRLKRAVPLVRGRIAQADMAPRLRNHFLSSLRELSNKRLDALAQGDGRRIDADIIYVSSSLSPDVVKDCVVLKKRGRMRVSVLVRESNENGNGDLFRACGIDLIEYQDYWELVGMLSHANASIVIARRGNPYDAALAVLFGSSVSLYKPYDFVLRYPPELIPSLFPRSEPHLAEQFILRHVAGLMHFHDEAAIQFVREHYGFSGRALQVRPEFVEEIAPESSHPKLSDTDGDIHLVYAAGLARVNADSRKTGASNQHEDFLRIVEQGLHLHVHIAYEKPEDRTGGLIPYYELAERCANFHIERSLPYNELLQALTRYDYAFSYFEKGNSEVSDAFTGPVTNNFYAYLEAGLPVLCSTYTWAVAEIVERHGIGIVLQDGDVSRLGSILRESNRLEFVANIVSSKPSMTYKAEEFLDFVRELSGLKQPVALASSEVEAD